MSFVEFLKYIFIAFVQGVAEILPISSSGHITLAGELVNLDASLSLSIFLHAGSLFAVIFYYKKELWLMIKHVFLYLFKKDRSEEVLASSKLVLMLIIATIPAGLVGVFLKDYIDELFKDNLFLGINFIITAVVLLIINKINCKRQIKEMTIWDAALVGTFQAVGVMPGISRSGITIAGLKTRKFESADAANFAFLMFIPISAGSFLFEIKDLITGDVTLSSTLVAPYIVSPIVAGIVTFIALKLLLKVIKKGKLWFFSIYLAILGVTVLILDILSVL